MPRFRKPPIVQAWLEFGFHRHSQRSNWTMEDAARFYDHVRQAFPRIEYQFRQEIAVENDNSPDLPKIASHQQFLDRARMYSGDGARCVQIGSDMLIYNLVLFGNAYPGFDVLLNEALVQLDNYRTIYGESTIQNVGLHYTDLIVIPMQPNLSIEDYFTVARDLPETVFGPITGVAIQYATECPLDKKLLRFELVTLPTGPNEYRFRMDWHKECAQTDYENREDLKASLLTTSNFMVECFEKSITPLTRHLFEPI